MINLKDYLTLIEKLNITQSQFLLLYCIHTKKPTQLSRYMKLFPTDDGTSIGQGLLDDLISNDLLYYELGIEKVTTKFSSNFLEITASKEIIELYPSDLMDESEFTIRVIYNQVIEYSIKEHKKIKSLIRFAVKENYTLPNLSKFIQSYYWKDIEKYKKNMKKV